MACNCITRKSTTPKTPACKNCLNLCDLFVKPTEGPNPCGGTDGTYEVDLKTVQNLTACTCNTDTTPAFKFYLLGHENFESVTLTEDGLLTAVTNTVDIHVPDNFYSIAVKVVCTDSVLSDTFNIRVGIKDLCFNIHCAENETCNPCNGLCEPNCINISTGGDPAVSITKINISTK